MAHVHQCVSAAIAVLFLLMGSTTVQGQCSICGDVPLRPDTASPDERGILTCLDEQTDASNLDAESSNCTEIQTRLVPYCCEVTLHECRTNVRSKLFRSAKYYDRGVAPSPPDNGESLDVEVTFGYYGVTDLNLKAGTVEIFVNLYLEWKDSRLAWTVNSSDTCTDFITTKASMDAAEGKSEIWVPDFNLINKVLGTEAMPDARAQVTSDGTVSWTRDGPLKAFCSFTGLSRIPFDTLGCRFIMGGGSTDLERTNYTLMLTEEDSDRIFIGYDNRGVKSSPNYAAYTLLESSTTVPGSEGSNIKFDFYFKRATSYYVTKIIVPNIIFTVLSFGVFLLDMRVGERLSYGMAVLLVNVAQDIVTQELLPVSDEVLWIDVLISGSFYWILIGVLESVIIGWLYFLRYDEHTGDSIASAAAESDRHDESSEKGDVSSHASSRHSSEDSDNDEGVERGQPHRSPRKNEISKGTLQTQASMFTLSQSLRTSRPTRVEFIRKIDRFCFIVIPSSYFLFLVVMFATNRKWGNDSFTTYTFLNGGSDSPANFTSA